MRLREGITPPPSRFGLLEEGRGVLLHQATSLIEGLTAIGHPLGLPADGLHALPMF
jgi:hypothetical protein